MAAPQGVGTVNPAQLCDDAYRQHVLVPVFCKGVGRFAGKGPTHYDSFGKTITLAGLQAVFDYWCSHGPWDAANGSCGEPDLADAAAEAALQTGVYVFNQEIVNAVYDDFVAWARDRCKRHPRLVKVAAVMGR